MAGASGSSGGAGGNQSSDQSSGKVSAGQDTAGKDSTGKSSTGKSSGGQNKPAGTGSGGNGTIGKCRTDDLSFLASDATIDGDGEGTVAVTLNNLGGDCTMFGFAGVDLKTSAGPLSAKRTSEPVSPMVLKANTSVSFGVHYPLNGSGGSGVRITGLVVTPPDETKSATIPWPGAATLPVTAGAGSPVTVGPMGSAGQGGAR
ncbi:DUF4232 domain-containing protein [Embleya sp. AB8]|uniref:DUF4232 domain-containing protein n=1 Tax=Embleya sp. AB8 TaxID=3156304 RepID=UPI003C784A24